MRNIWILVAESSQAKIYQAELTLDTITELHHLEHQESRMRERDITSDLPGSNAASGSGSHHRFEPHTGIKEQETINFAREINGLLDEGRRAKAYAKLAVIASPDFLGQLRSGMNPQVRKLVAHEVDKNVVRAPEAELRKLLPKTFYSHIE